MEVSWMSFFEGARTGELQMGLQALQAHVFDTILAGLLGLTFNHFGLTVGSSD